MVKISEIWAHKLLAGLHVTEKSSILTKNLNKIIIKVEKEANKQEIKEACKMVFGIEVVSVNVMNTKPRLRGFKGQVGRRQSFKKAIVTFVKDAALERMVGN